MENLDTNKSMRDFMPSDNVEGEENTTEVVETTPVVPGEPKDSDVPAATPQEPMQTPEQTFATSFDPTKLSPELQAAYKQMQGDYTKKTQELASVRKFHETYSQYEPLLTFIAKNPQLAEAYITGNKNPAPGQAPTEQPKVEYSDDPVEFAKQIREEAKKEAVSEMMKLFNEQQQQQVFQQKVEADIAEAESLDPRLANDEEFADQVAAIVLSDDGVRNGTKSYAQATRDAIAKVDGFTNKRIEAEKQKLTQMAKQKRSPVAPSSPATTVQSGQQPKTMREAAAEFLK